VNEQCAFKQLGRGKHILPYRVPGTQCPHYNKPGVSPTDEFLFLRLRHPVQRMERWIHPAITNTFVTRGCVENGNPAKRSSPPSGFRDGQNPTDAADRVGFLHVVGEQKRHFLS